jgi:hypothetical protein
MVSLIRQVAVMKNIYEFRSGKVPTTSRVSDALLEELLAFERLLADLSARIANASGEQVETEIESALKEPRAARVIGNDYGRSIGF